MNEHIKCILLPTKNLSNDIILPSVKQKIKVARTEFMNKIKTFGDKEAFVYFVSVKKDCDISLSCVESKDFESVGVVGKITEIFKSDKQFMDIEIMGLTRAKLISIDEKVSKSDENIFYCECEALSYVTLDDAEEKTLVSLLVDGLDLLANKFRLTFLKIFKDELKNDFAVNATLDRLVVNLENFDKLEFLKLNDTKSRLEMVCESVQTTISKFETLGRMQKKTDEKIRQAQEDYVLREQIKVIKEELGDDDKDLDDIKNKLEKLPIDEESRKKLLYDYDKMAKTPYTSPEYAIISSYLEFATDLPWKTYGDDNFDLEEIKAKLDADHYGIDNVKERIVEYVAVKQLVGSDTKSPILCLVGPPGVGKTSIAQSIARALNKEYVHLSLGGVKDEAELRGHRKTYLGAMAGRIIKSLARAKTSNPLFLLDEVDKLANDMRGDPASALLEILDPNQNATFRDNYLELPYDLSRAMFIMTANNLDSISKPLLDRMEVIEMSSYTLDDKLNIAVRYLIPKQIKENGLEGRSVEWQPQAIEMLVNNYTREAGVRELERIVGKICRKIAINIVNGNSEDYVIDPKAVEKYLGAPKFNIGDEIINGEIGAVNGLAWTAVGGVVMPVEVRLIKGSGETILTGSLGDVIKESAKIAISLVKSKCEEFGVNVDDFKNFDIHINMPKGGVPKDGPSAGITLTTAIMSAFAKKMIVSKLAMTGEITLRGKVLAIGGLKEKLIAAQKNGVEIAIIPQENKKDMADVPASVQEKLQMHYVDNIDEVFAIAFGENK
ncbi:MAG: endopeptidase La [Clostridia bacterium]